MKLEYSDIFRFNENLDTKEVSLQIGRNFFKIGFENILNINNDEETILILNKLFNHSEKYNSGYVDSVVWYSFIATSNIEIPPIKEKYKTINFENLEIEDLSVQRSGRNINTTISKKDFVDNDPYTKKQKPLFPLLNKNSILESSLPSDKFCLIIQKTVYYNTNVEFIISFLHCIFSAKKRYYLKKCNICDKYYIADKSDNCYCKIERSFEGKMTTCNKIAEAYRKTPKYIEINNMHKKLLRYLNDSNKYTENYIEEYKHKFKEQIKLYLKTNNINSLRDFVIDFKNNSTNHNF